jgi:hypothetical protein
MPISYIIYLYTYRLFGRFQPQPVLGECKVIQGIGLTIDVAGLMTQRGPNILQRVIVYTHFLTVQLTSHIERTRARHPSGATLYPDNAMATACMFVS